MRKILHAVTAVVVISVMPWGNASYARNVVDDFPAYCGRLHNVGKVKLCVGNAGMPVGTGFSVKDCVTGEFISGLCEYPKDSRLDYMGPLMLWIGAVVGRDTLVSTGHNGWGYPGWEFSPDISPFGDIVERSINDPDPAISDLAVSEQDFICTYTDTLVSEYYSYDYLDHRPHIPMFIEVTQSSYAWSYEYAEDFVLFDLHLRNFGQKTWKDMYLALKVTIGGDQGSNSVGFRHTAPSPLGCGYEDTLNLAWGSENDGDPIDGVWVEPARRREWPEFGWEGSQRSAVAVRILQPPSQFLDMSFNWWVSSGNPEWDWGPRHKTDTRSFGHSGNGTPMGDRMQYHIMRNHEFDPPKVETAYLSPTDTLWQMPRSDLAERFAKTGGASMLLSYGAFRHVEPGEDVHIAFAVICGENFHNDVTNGDNLPYRPDLWTAGVDFSDLDRNALWAEWIYDNPGVDTDGDNYFGEFRVCGYDSIETDSGWVMTVADTTWYRGDGIPDWRGAGPPPAPYIFIERLDHGLRVRFNGERSETEKDIFSHLIDFEGYRIYFGRDERHSSLSLVASYDRHNFDRYVWNMERAPDPGFELRDVPFTLEQLRCRYGRGDNPCDDRDFDPLDYDRNHWYTHPDFADSLMYFTTHDYNASDPGRTTDIRKLYPETRDPRTVSPEQLTDDDYTDEGHYKFFEWEYVIDDLLPSVAYCVNVTAFDFGSPSSGLDVQETSRTNGLITAYPAGSEQIADGSDKRVYVYPNPYRIDGNYSDLGYEGRERPDLPSFRTQTVHFANIPPECTIRIHSLDGDLIRRIDHSDDTSGEPRNHATWNLITRNHQLVVSGLYYWTVESPGRSTQIGKLAILQ